jgi:hypothetical protein
MPSRNGIRVRGRSRSRVGRARSETQWMIVQMPTIVRCARTFAQCRVFRRQLQCVPEPHQHRFMQTGTIPPAVPATDDMLSMSMVGCRGMTAATVPPILPAILSLIRLITAPFIRHISLQYLAPLGTFNPYVNLVPGPTSTCPGLCVLDRRPCRQYTCAGRGFVLTVAGPNGLDNALQYDLSKIVHGAWNGTYQPPRMAAV